MIICCFQISEVVNHMKDLIEFTNKNNLGPIGMIMHIYLSLSSVYTYHCFQSIPIIVLSLYPVVNC